MSPVEYPGKEILLGSATYVLPPCGMDLMETHGALIEKHFFGVKKSANVFDVEKFKLIIDMVHGALLLNYPDLPRQTVAKGLNMGNVMQIVELALSQNLPTPPEALRSNAGDAEGGRVPLGESLGAATAPP